MINSIFQPSASSLSPPSDLSTWCVWWGLPRQGRQRGKINSQQRRWCLPRPWKKKYKRYVCTWGKKSLYWNLNKQDRQRGFYFLEERKNFKKENILTFLPVKPLSISCNSTKPESLTKTSPTIAVTHITTWTRGACSQYFPPGSGATQVEGLPFSLEELCRRLTRSWRQCRNKP